MKTDYISRRAFVEAKEKQYCRNCDRRKNSKGQVVYSIGDAPCRACGIRDVLDDVEDFPTADVRPVVYGEWINKRHGIGWCSAECSICGNHVGGRAIDTGFGFDYTFPKLCDNCGADMTGGGDG